ncbi:MAG: S-adenosylmethionine:tRNA ribosyltransferase-isomerase, partial [Candidatus Omnitrophica bacterium]|nr:S-adenosylmethionine:tRNA ribosyltransferase-isomerase [Candidatus Omnitrophota bacterium]
MSKDLFKATNYDLKIAEHLIAQSPKYPRDKSRLLVLERNSGRLTEKIFKDMVDFFQKGDCLVLNNTKVFKARIFGKKDTGAKIEIFL